MRNSISCPACTPRPFNPHTRVSLALWLEDKTETTFVYTSATGYTDALSCFASGVTLFMTECSFCRDKLVETHLKLADAIKLAHRAAPSKVLLPHLHPEWDGINVAAEAKKLWPGELSRGVTACAWRLHPALAVRERDSRSEPVSLEFLTGET